MYHSYTIYGMSKDSTKAKPSTTVRIAADTKKRLEKVVRKMSDKQDRNVTELELADEAVTEFVEKFEKKLGIKA
jgi:hypothetical protein